MSRKHNPSYVKRGPNSLKELIQERKDFENIWNDLSHLQAQCFQLNQSPTQVVALLRNQELVARVADKDSLMQLANTLNRDVQDFSTRLNQLNAAVDQHRGGVVDLPKLALLMDVAQAYDQWITSYQLVVVPTAMQITDLFNQLNQNPQV